MKKIAILLGFCLFFALESKGQSEFLQLLDNSQSWILNTPRIERKALEFVNYSKDKVELNTMIWKFQPNGKLEYDYQSSENIFACAGVNFIDMDIDECNWTYDQNSMILTLQIKGGYASIDDFIFKRDYKVRLINRDDEYGYQLDFVKEHFYKSLKKTK